MTQWWQILLTVAGGVLLLWVVLVALLWREQRRHGVPTRLRDLLRLVPDVIRLLKRLATDRSVPASSWRSCCCTCCRRST